MNDSPLKTIAVIGNGLAGTLCAAALASSLPRTIKLILVETPNAATTDAFYGNVTSPATYEFLLNIGLTEPQLLLGSNTAFSLGTRYENWGEEKHGWTQSFHRPLPLFQGVDFHHYLTKLRDTAPALSGLEPYIMSVHAARRGVFAHPPEDKKTPLATMEYGYHFMPQHWRDIISRHLEKFVTKLNGGITFVKREGDYISAIELSGGTKLTADLFIDCQSPKANMSLSMAKPQKAKRKLKIAESFTPQEKTEGVCRVLTATDYGWRSETSLQNGRHHITICAPESEEEALKAHPSIPQMSEASLGYCAEPWQGNCLALGHSAAILEPLTPAPMMMLQRDIERLIELIPTTKIMPVEAREYNRRFTEDYDHAAAFQRTFFELAQPPETPYWKAARAEPISEKLRHKITQFQSRGIAVQYDLEPFDKKDWIQLHFGMNRLPARYDILSDRIAEDQLISTLQKMRGANEAMALKMPPHHIYMDGLLKYLRKKHG